MSIEEAKDKFTKLLREIKTDNEKNKFLKWIYTNWKIDSLPDEDADLVNVLKSIADELRSVVPFEAVLPSENIKHPVSGPNADCKVHSTIHVDEFLYSDEYLDELVEKGLVSKYYCSDCHSKNVKLFTFISHSMSISKIQYLFKCLLPPLKRETILDVGSRLGPVLYGAFLYTQSPKIIGVEINPDFCKIQSDIVKKFHFDARIKVICNSIVNEIEVLSSSDVVILNNVFEFFTAIEDTVSSWRLLARNIRVGCILITIPSLKETFKHIKTAPVLDIFKYLKKNNSGIIRVGCILITIPSLKETFKHIKMGFNWKDWAEEIDESQPGGHSCSLEELEEHRESMRQYRVKKQIMLD